MHEERAMDSDSSSHRLENQFKVTEIASWTFGATLCTLIQSPFLSVGSHLILNVVVGTFLFVSVVTHRWLPRKCSLETCFFVEAISFLVLVSFLIHFTGGPQSPFWLLYYLPVMIALVTLGTRACFAVLLFAIVLYILETAKTYWERDWERLPVVILNVFNLIAMTALGYSLSKALGEERMLKDIALREKEVALLERDRNMKLLRERQEEVEEFGRRLSETNQELMAQQAQLLHATEALERMNKELREMDQVKNDFVSMVSHELKTPLTVIKESLSLILEDTQVPLSPEQGKFLGIAQHSAGRLSSLIQEVLDFSKLESRKVKMHREKLDASLEIQFLKEQYLTLLGDKKLNLNVVASVEALIYADRGRFHQVIDNLVNNAVKFTPAQGTIEIGIEKMDQAAILKALQSTGADQDVLKDPEMLQLTLWKNFVVIFVRNSGLGISKGDLNKVFEKFFQVDTREGRPKGAGLGLAIVKKLILMHQGGVWVESENAKGTCFKIALPVFEEASDVWEKLGEWVRQVRASHEEAMLMTLDFKNAFITWGEWEVAKGMMEEVYRVMLNLIVLGKEVVYRVGPYQFLMLSLGSDHARPVEVLEEVQSHLHEQGWTELETGIHSTFESFSWNSLKLETLLEYVERLIYGVQDEEG
ncbi:MAG: hypothetical protein HYS08_09375 [Chlamydiae bacterium]|nr:hypothetical protein [Chlamydiota bacterium]MBI3265671.1 hypothetical protein [Chlamydiota bacterium]